MVQYEAYPEAFHLDKAAKWTTKRAGWLVNIDIDPSGLMNVLLISIGKPSMESVRRLFMTAWEVEIDQLMSHRRLPGEGFARNS